MAQCPSCHGLRWIGYDRFGKRVADLKKAAQIVACDECYGYALIYCCEGSQAQPEPEESE